MMVELKAVLMVVLMVCETVEQMAVKTEEMRVEKMALLMDIMSAELLV